MSESHYNYALNDVYSPQSSKDHERSPTEDQAGALDDHHARIGGRNRVLFSATHGTHGTIDNRRSQLELSPNDSGEQQLDMMSEDHREVSGDVGGKDEQSRYIPEYPQSQAPQQSHGHGQSPVPGSGPGHGPGSVPVPVPVQVQVPVQAQIQVPVHNSPRTQPQAPQDDFYKPKYEKFGSAKFLEPHASLYIPGPHEQALSYSPAPLGTPQPYSEPHDRQYGQLPPQTPTPGPGPSQPVSVGTPGTYRPGDRDIDREHDDDPHSKTSSPQRRRKRDTKVSREPAMPAKGRPENPGMPGKGHTRKQSSISGRAMDRTHRATASASVPTYIPGAMGQTIPDPVLRPPGGYYWGAAGDDHGKRGGRMSASTIPIQLCEPPLRNIIPPNPAALAPDPQPRSRKKSKYTAEQDKLILDLKHEGRTWSEIAQLANCDKTLSARNRYQVLIGQQGGGGYFWDEGEPRMLQELLDEGERARWKYIAEELSLRRGRRFTMEMCHYKISQMFAQNPETFGIKRYTNPEDGAPPMERHEYADAQQYEYADPYNRGPQGQGPGQPGSRPRPDQDDSAGLNIMFQPREGHPSGRK